MTGARGQQKAIFCADEGDAYFARNAAAHQNREFPGNDRQALAIVQLVEAIRNTQDTPGSALTMPSTLLEIGCGDGARLEWISKQFGIRCSGIDPSASAINAARERGIDARVGTADQLPFEAGYFDLVLFGHCLYLCDPDDLFSIASETNRVLKESGWVIISDFFTEHYTRVPYRHREGVFSHKMDYRKLFEWHPSYTCVSHHVGDMSAFNLSDVASDWVAVSILRKVSSQVP